MTVPLAALATTLERITTVFAQLLGMALLAGLVALFAALAYRWYVREAIPWALAVLLGLAGVAGLLNTTSVLGQVMVGATEVTETQEALFNIAAFGAGAVGSMAGRRVGDGAGADLFETTRTPAVDEGLSRLVTAVGRVITVELPADIDDVVGYDPVPESTKETLASRRFLFPRGLTVGELEARLIARLKTDYAVGHVDVELEADGSVEHIGLGSRAAGIGPTLPPATNAVAVRADPAFAASAGDLVQVWEPDPLSRVLTAELRGVADDVVTLAIDAADTPKLDPETRYRLVTLPVEDRPEREFVSLLRAADETHTAVTVGAGSPLDGIAVGALDVTVVAVTPSDEKPVPLPPATHVLRARDVVNVVARPEALRRLEAAAGAVAMPASGAPSPTGAAGRPDTSEGQRSSEDPSPTDPVQSSAEGEELPLTDEAVSEPDGDDKSTPDPDSDQDAPPDGAPDRGADQDPDPPPAHEEPAPDAEGARDDEYGSADDRRDG